MGGGKSKSGKSAARAQERSNLAAQAEIRRQFDITRKSLSPFLRAGRDEIPTVQERTTVEGLDAILGEIFGSENFANLRDERLRAVEGQLASSGLSRSGTALLESARVPTDLGFALEQLLTGRSQDLTASGQNAAAQLGTFGQNAAGGIAGLSQNTGQAAAQGKLADQQARAQGFQNTLGTVATIGSIFFSDPALKTNVEEIGKINDLHVYQWDWKSSTDGTLIEQCGNIGFMADEVESLYPEHVYEYGGFKIIDYPELLNRLDKDSADRLVEIEKLPDEGEYDARFKYN